ncbi:hypothetical protein GCM10010921_11740 [Microbacterium album]|uniref:PA14 domain-containing protein n=1 Tax=Microbacterium album TaxID=2053191 RepID=A0A917IEA2_9MICO|nr:hypothetical protein GCM10010921_11740 [Microbacterium album]
MPRRMLAGALTTLLAVAGLVVVPAQPAAAAPPTVETVNNPAGVTMTMFDYWVTGTQSSPDTAMAGCDPSYYRAGINGAPAGSDFFPTGHVLKFGKQIKWTDCYNRDLGVYNTLSINKTIPNGNRGDIQNVGTGTVEPSLSDYGMPVVAARSDRFGSNPRESLGYLFDPAVENPGKASYDVNNPNLFQYDYDTGFLRYDSAENYAWFDDANGRFEVYDRPSAMRPSGSGQTVGQFFPFNSPDEVFAGETPINMSVEDPRLNHYFGMAMRASFYQPPGGRVQTPQGTTEDMVFNFSGDDDVWVFVDGQLAMDLGGTHGIANGSINFATGVVTTSVEGVSGQRTSTLPGWNEGAFGDNTVHELAFFYLERGNYVSNMSLEFNLNTLPVSTGHKVTEDGQPLAGASFALYNTGSDYQVTGDEPLCTDAPAAPCLIGEYTTSSAPGSVGDFPLLHPDGSMVDFGEYETEYFVLRETATPIGYRALSNDVQIRYSELLDDVAGSNGLEVVNYAQTGVWISFDTWVRPASNVVDIVTADGTAVGDLDMREVTASSPADGGNGMYALVAAIGPDGTYHPLTGSHDDGWAYADGSFEMAAGNALTTNAQGVITGGLDGVDAQWLHPDSGTYRAELDDLPGLLREYWTPGADNSGARYVLLVYMQDGDERRLLDTADFQRNRVADVRIPNRSFDQLHLRKVDASGAPLAGASFTVFGEIECEDGTRAWTQGSSTLTTDASGELTLTPADIAPYVAPEGCTRTGALEIRETQAPEGYLPVHPIPAWLDRNGVRIDAGDEVTDPLDSVAVEHVVRRISQPIIGRGMNDAMTRVSGLADLSAVRAALVTADSPTPDSWSAPVAEADLQYDQAADDGTYVGLDGDPVVLRTEHGYSDVPIYPAQDTGGVTADTDISGSFSIDQTVVITDHRSALEISKSVQEPAPGYLPDLGEREFTFDVAVDGLPDGEYRVAYVDAATGAETRAEMVAFAGGVAQIVLHHGETARIYDLPLGAAFTVTETGLPPGYSVASPSGGTATGTIPPDAADGAATVAFVNEYATEAEFVIPATKSLSGQPLDAGDFTFVITPQNDPSRTLATGTNAAAAAGEPGAIQFDADPSTPGDQPLRLTTAELLEAVEQGWATRSGNIVILRLRVAEVTDNLPPGVTPGRTVENVWVLIRDNGDGTVDAEPYLGGRPAVEFTNTYATDDVPVPFYALKTLQNAPGTALAIGEIEGDFTFVLRPVGEFAAIAPMPDGTQGVGADRFVEEVNDAEGLVDFGSATFSLDLLGGEPTRTFTYEVTERRTEAGAAPGVSVDSDPQTFTVTLTDNGDGTLAVAISGDPRFDFVNTYSVEPVSDAFGVEKDLTGRPWQGGDAFTFVLEATGPGAASTPMPGGASGTPPTATVTIDADTPGLAASFGDIVYTQPGVYTYVISEQQTGVGDGVAFSQARYEVVVTVADNGDGTMTLDRQVTRVVGDAGETTSEAVTGNALFTNAYTAAPAVLDGFEATKGLDGRALRDDDRFDFVLVPTGPAAATTPMPGDAVGGEAAASAVAPDWTAVFGDIRYGTVGTWTYEVFERAPSPGAEGVTYSQARYQITVTVADDGAGSLTATSEIVQLLDDAGGTVGAPASDMAFTNTYTPLPVRDAFPVAKAFVDADGVDAWTADDEFTFDLRPITAGAPMPADAVGGVASVTVGAEFQGTEFGQIEYAEPGLYQYEIVERPPADPLAGVTYSQARYVVSVLVQREDDRLTVSHEITQATADDGSGDTVPGDHPTPVFTNLYEEPTVTADIPVQKVVTGREWSRDDAFIFTLTPTGPEAGTAPLPPGAQGGIASVTITNATPDHTTTFGEMVFTGPGTWTYLVAEEVPDPTGPGERWSLAEYLVTVTVTEAPNGALSAQTTIEQTVADDGGPGTGAAETPVFTNRHLPPAEVEIPVEKRIEGRDWTADDAFVFTLTATGDNAATAPLPDGAVGGVATVTATADQRAPVFPAMEYVDIGTWTYRIAEVVPSAPSDGMTYSQAVYDVTVEVAEAAGGLVTEVSYTQAADDGGAPTGTPADAVVFVNTWVPEEPPGPPPTTPPPTDPGTPPGAGGPEDPGPLLPGRPLPATGSEIATWTIAGAAIALLLGAALLLASRHRRRTREAGSEPGAQDE